MYRIIRLSCLLIFALVLTSLGKAQTTSGSIAGSLTDPQQAAVAGATVTVSDETKGFSLTATTDKEGRFVFPQLPPGTYTISVEASGFKKLQRTGIALVANDKGQRLSRLARERYDVVMSIPMRKHVSSLNASAALAAALYGYLLPSRAAGSAVGTRR